MIEIRKKFICVVTGNNCYKYLTLEDSLRAFNEVQSGIDAQGAVISTEYSCHCWTTDVVQLVIGTAQGEIIVCNMNGEFLISVPDAPGSPLNCIQPWGRGIILAGEGGMIYPYETTLNESQIYRR